MKTVFLFILILLFNSCSSELTKGDIQARQKEIQFSTYRREYALKKYDHDSVKLSRPLQYIKSAYYATYTLNSKELVIYKMDKKNADTRTAIFRSPLKKKQALRFHRALSYINVDSIASQSAHISAEDGFQVEVALIKKRKSAVFLWNNTYVPPLFDLLSLVNILSPDPLKFYPVAKEAAFRQYLQGMSATQK